MNTEQNQTENERARADTFLALAKRFRESSDEEEVTELGNQLG